MSTQGKRERLGPFTVGELNRCIDAAIHPLAKKSPWLWALDTALHACVERNPTQTAVKFLRFTFPKISKEIIRELEKRAKRE